MRKKLKTESLPVRMSQPELDLIIAAAQVVGESRSEFLRNAAKKRASDVMASLEASA
jgi:uncharacterized protein (DUF1778 family)